MHRHGLFLFSLFLMVLLGFADRAKSSIPTQYRVYGIVQDAETGERLMLTNITVEGTVKGTITDRDGRYTLLLPPGEYELLFRYMGYSSIRKPVKITDRDIQLDVQLQPTVLDLPPLTPLREANPGLEIIKKTIENREKSMAKLKGYRFTTQSALTIQGKGASDSICRTDIEAVVRWGRQKGEEEIALAVERGGAPPPNPDLFPQGMLTMNFLNHPIRLGGKKIVGPLSQEGLKSYHYSLVGEAVIDHKRVYKIKVWPRSNCKPSLKGTLYITTDIHWVMKVDLELNEAALPKLFTQMHYRQQYALIDDRFSMPINLDLEAKGRVDTGGHLGFSLYGTSLFKDHQIDEAAK